MAHIPERTCLACGRKVGKPELLRISCNKDGSIAVDPRQRLPGRGAYVCRTLACGELLKKRKGLHHGFRRPVAIEVYDQIILYLRDHAAT
ncbi:YlxR family protein [candidate division KSB1 bacterium]|nr:YlxR family protein [candidate division KSB1 bacterium]